MINSFRLVNRVNGISNLIPSDLLSAADFLIESKDNLFNKYLIKKNGKIVNMFDSKIKNPLSVGFLTGLMPCASSLAVVAMTGANPNILWTLYFIGVYVLGFAVVLFLIVTLFSVTKNLFLTKIESIEKKINLDLVSGCLILLVGMVYLSYNWGAHAH